MAANESKRRSRRSGGLRRALTPTGPAERPDAVRLTRLRAPGVDVPAVGAALGRWYESQGMAAQVLPHHDGVIVQARSSGLVRRLSGSATALTVILRSEGADLAVEIGPAKWLRKGAIGGVALATSHLFLAVPFAYGAFAQARLPRRTVQFIAATLPSYLPSAGSAPQGARTRVEPEAQHADPPLRLVEVNSATAVELAGVPGLPAEVAAQIRARRDAAGPYGSWDDLVVRLADCASPAVMAAIRPWMLVTPPPPEPPPPGAPSGGFRRPERGPPG